MCVFVCLCGAVILKVFVCFVCELLCDDVYFVFVCTCSVLVFVCVCVLVVACVCVLL